MSAIATVTMTAAGIGAVVAVAGLVYHARRMAALPFKLDVAPAKGSVAKGIIYAYTLGMAPWEKESTRRHPFAYLRGIVFHAGIFAALLTLALSPWLGKVLPSGAGIGAQSLIAAIGLFLALLAGLGGLAGIAGLVARLGEENLRSLSSKDDYFAVALVSLFTLAALLALLAPAMVPVFQLIGALTLLYLPLGKVRHIVYFFYSRYAFGTLFGHRGVLEKARN